LQSLARKVPDIPDFLDRAENAFDIIMENRKTINTHQYEKKSFKTHIGFASGIVVIFIATILLI
jgi:hypothetical protein